MVLCKCGCGKYLPEKYEGKLGFLHGHNSKGRIKSLEEREKIKIALNDPIIKRKHSIANKLSRTKEVKNKISESMKLKNIKRSVVTKNNMSKAALKRWEDKSYRDRCTKTGSNFLRNYLKLNGPWNKEKLMSKEYKENVSNGVSLAYLEGRCNKAGIGKSGYFHSNKNQKEVHYRSSYELIAFELLEHDNNVKYYKVEPFRISYIDKDGISRYTIPDLLVTYLDESNKLIEIKPTFKLKYIEEQIKINADKQFAKNNGYEFQIWSEKELGLD